MRQQFRARRRSLAPALRNNSTQRIISNLQNYKPVRKAKCVGAYIAFDGEVDLQAWIDDSKRRVALPVIANSPSQTSMKFHEYQRNEPLLPNHFNIPEPGPKSPRVKAKEIDVLLMPLVAFDATGTRMGMGAGYYDRYLANIKHRPLLVGVAYACQQATTLQRQAWDIPLNAVVTEDGMLEF